MASDKKTTSDFSQTSSFQSVYTSTQPEDPSADVEKSSEPRAAHDHDESEFGPPPDGGLEAWLVVLGGFCTTYASFGWINCIGVFQAYYQQNQLKAYNPSTVAWIPSTESFMLSFLVTDDYGPRYPILFGSFLHVFGLMMTSISSEYYQIFLSQSVCSAVGCSFLFYPTIAALGTWFHRHRALAFGIAIAGSAIGGVVMPIMLHRIIDHAGFGWAMRAAAFFFLGILIIGNLTVKSRLPPLRRKFKIKDFVVPFTEIPFLLLAMASFLLYLGGLLPFNFIIVEAQANGMSKQLSGYLVSIINAACIFGRIVPAQIADMYGVFNVMILFTGLGGIFNLTVWLTASSDAALIVFAILCGFTAGCTFSIIPAMVASISDPRQLGTRNGALHSVAACGVLIGSPIAGAIVHSQNGRFSGLIIFSGVCLLAGTGITILSRQALVGLRLVVKV